MGHRPAPDSPVDGERYAEQIHPDLSWFLRRELVAIPLAIVIVGTLLLFGISPATLLFLALLTVLVLGFVWSPGSNE